MASLSDFLQHFDRTRFLMLLLSAAASLLCITFHELSHGWTAYRLGDPTAKQAGRLTLNPIRHIDWLGLAMMLTVRVGWAKPVPVDMRYFRHPKRDMALTALAGPLSNFLLALVALLAANLVLRFSGGGEWAVYVLLFLLYVAVLSVGLGIFNLIPVSPMDGSKILLALLPDRAYYTVLRYERFGMIAIVALTWLGVFSRPLSFLMEHLLQGMCVVTRFPFSLVQYFFF